MYNNFFFVTRVLQIFFFCFKEEKTVLETVSKHTLTLCFVIYPNG